MFRFIILLFLLQVNIAQSQRIFSANGAMASFLDMKTTTPDDVSSSVFPKGIIRPTISLGFETPQWQHFSLTTTGSYFTTGGSRNEQPNNSPTYQLFNNFCLGLSGNYYLVDSKTQLYLGVGPRMDYIRSEGAVYSEKFGDSYYKQEVRVFKFGITGSIGLNFQLDRVILGIKSNYYYRPSLLKKDFNTTPDNWGLTNQYKNITIKDHLFDLQFVIGYRLEKNNK